MSAAEFCEQIADDIRLWSMGDGFVLGIDGDPLRWVPLTADECTRLAEVAQAAARYADPETVLEQLARERAEEFRVVTLAESRRRAAELRAVYAASKSESKA